MVALFANLVVGVSVIRLKHLLLKIVSFLEEKEQITIWVWSIIRE